MFNISQYVLTYGSTIVYFILFFIIFAETGLMLGFFLPGDSLLFTAGVLASQGYFDITTVCVLMFFASTIGNTTGYFFGHKVGKRLFRKEDSVLFHKDNLVHAKNFYEKHGGKALVLARFIPLIRTFAPIVAGIGDMNFVQFTIYNVIGALLWAVALPVGGYYLGKSIPDVDKYLLPIIGLIVLASIFPTLYHMFKEKENRAKFAHHARRLLTRKK